MSGLPFAQLSAHWLHVLVQTSIEAPLFVALASVALFLFMRYEHQLFHTALRGLGAKGAKPGLASQAGAQPVAGGANNVAAYWAGQFGRYKYCGLRPDPLDTSRGPPEYSLAPLDLPLPELSSHQAAFLEAFAKRVGDLSARHRTDPSTLVRYLRARKFNLDQAEKYFREAAAWRDAHGATEALTQWNLKAYEQCLAPWWLSGGFLGHGLQGEIIAYERLAHCDWAGLVRSMPWEVIEKLDVVHCVRALAACEEDCLLRGTPMGKGILVEDCHGFGWEQAAPSGTRALNRLIENRNYILPECLTKILVIRAPAAWVYAWKMFSYIMDPGTREKVQVAGSDAESLALLRKYISDDEIPAYLGGKKCIAGDPECRKVLAPGGALPDEARSRFFQLLADPDAAVHPAQPQRSQEEQEPEEGDLFGLCGSRKCCG